MSTENDLGVDEVLQRLCEGDEEKRLLLEEHRELMMQKLSILENDLDNGKITPTEFANQSNALCTESLRKMSDIVGHAIVREVFYLEAYPDFYPGQADFQLVEPELMEKSESMRKK